MVDQQPCCAEQDERQRDLRDDQQTADQASRPALTKRAAIAQRRDLRRSKRVPRGHHAEEHAGDHGNARREQQHAHVRLHIEVEPLGQPDHRTARKQDLHEPRRTCVGERDADDRAAA